MKRGTRHCTDAIEYVWLHPYLGGSSHQLKIDMETGESGSSHFNLEVPTFFQSIQSIQEMSKSRPFHFPRIQAYLRYRGTALVPVMNPFQVKDTGMPGRREPPRVGVCLPNRRERFAY